MRQTRKKTAARHTRRQAASHASRRRMRSAAVAPDLGSDRWDDEKAYGPRDRSRGLFTPGEMGQPDQAPSPGADNPQAVQGGLGPLGQQGQGNRQNDELDELESVDEDEPRKDLKDRM